jgi:thiosulfate reductase cytochrome b subunit
VKLMVKHKVIGFAVIATLLPVLVMSTLLMFHKRHASSEVRGKLDAMVEEHTSQMVFDVYNMARSPTKRVVMSTRS